MFREGERQGQVYGVLRRINDGWTDGRISEGGNGVGPREEAGGGVEPL